MLSYPRSNLKRSMTVSKSEEGGWSSINSILEKATDGVKKKICAMHVSEHWPFMKKF